MSNQNPQQIKNPGTKIEKTPEMNDRDFVNDLLLTEKYLTTSYTVAVHEASHQGLYEEILTVFNETEKAQRDLYELMFRKGWYAVEEVDEQKLQQKYKQFQGYTNQFPAGGNLQ